MNFVSGSTKKREEPVAYMDGICIGMRFMKKRNVLRVSWVVSLRVSFLSSKFGLATLSLQPATSKNFKYCCPINFLFLILFNVCFSHPKIPNVTFSSVRVHSHFRTFVVVRLRREETHETRSELEFVFWFVARNHTWNY